MKFFTIGILLLTASTTLMAQEDCSQYSSIVDIYHCTLNNLNEADQHLNKIYNQVFAREDKIAQKKLRDAQRAWIKYRDLKCTYDADVMRDEKAQIIMSLGCALVETKNKSAEFDQMINPDPAIVGKAKIYTVEKTESQVAQSQIFISGASAKVLFENLDIPDRGAGGYVIREGKHTSCSGRNGEYECSISIGSKGEAISIE